MNQSNISDTYKTTNCPRHNVLHAQYWCVVFLADRTAAVTFCLVRDNTGTPAVAISVVDAIGASSTRKCSAKSKLALQRTRKGQYARKKTFACMPQSTHGAVFGSCFARQSGIAQQCCSTGWSCTRRALGVKADGLLIKETMLYVVTTYETCRDHGEKKENNGQTRSAFVTDTPISRLYI